MDLSSFLRIGPMQIVLWICAAIFIWLGVREIRTWYWKQNEMIALLKKIEENTRKDYSSGAVTSKSNDESTSH